MSVQLLVLLLALEVEDQDFIGAALLNDLAADKGLRRLTEFTLGAADRQHFVELNVFTAGLRQLLDLDYVSGCDAILLSPARITAYMAMPPMNFSDKGYATRGC